MTACSSESPERHAVGGAAIDRSVLGEWFAGDDVAVNELLMVFRDSAMAEHRQMANALAMGDLAELARAAHRLRGVALSMGAQDLAKAAAAVDIAAKANDAASCEAGMPELEARMRLMVAEVPFAKDQRPR